MFTKILNKLGLYTSHQIARESWIQFDRGWSDGEQYGMAIGKRDGRIEMLEELADERS